MARIRKKLSALVLWFVFLGLYLGGAVMLAIGVFFASRQWRAAIHRHAGPWEIGTKTAEFFILALGLILVLIVPILEYKSVYRRGAWKTGRRSESKSQSPDPEKDCLITR
jgi:heme/copper-type cytochrome/quinol oxidase subunit 1